MLTFLPNDRPQLLQRPVRARVRCHADVGRPTCAVLDDNKHLENAERRRDRHEGVACENRLCVVLQEAGPALIATRLPRRLLRQVLADRSRRDPDSELDQ